jgi:hypothetical protein
MTFSDSQWNVLIPCFGFGNFLRRELRAQEKICEQEMRYAFWNTSRKKPSGEQSKPALKGKPSKLTMTSYFQLLDKRPVVDGDTDNPADRISDTVLSKGECKQILTASNVESFIAQLGKNPGRPLDVIFPQSFPEILLHGVLTVSPPPAAPLLVAQTSKTFSESPTAWSRHRLPQPARRNVASCSGAAAAMRAVAGQLAAFLRGEVSGIRGEAQAGDRVASASDSSAAAATCAGARRSHARRRGAAVRSAPCGSPPAHVHLRMPQAADTAADGDRFRHHCKRRRGQFSDL